ncbi:pilus assembly PilX family protein [Marinicella gelatinilytica]|uniref:pilus assembly PilX family protein n=1 Tax=Marinicella gelatinilytica TaxID=2996017 RepID=UPI002260CB9C|nr:PilX N-terminal domain-containing pilus assembly protein [Marinicella gelatinilytica]MCX7544582.1 PilX N-terminal domain-containing pilus assembly protein [Marinicella gelatinilytica]
MIRTSKNKQQGAALVVGLILLLIITLMGYASMKGTMLQEKMAAGLHNRSLAYAGANSAVRAGEEFIFNLVQQTNGVNIKGTPGGMFYGIYSYLDTLDSDPTQGLNTTVEAFKKRNWTSSAGTDHLHDFTNASFNGALERRPQFIVEEIVGAGAQTMDSQEFGAASGDGNVQKAFLITGKGPSGDGNSIALTQSMYTVVVSSSSSN